MEICEQDCKNVIDNMGFSSIGIKYEIIKNLFFEFNVHKTTLLSGYPNIYVCLFLSTWEANWK